METNSALQKQSRYTQGGRTDRYTNRLGWWERVYFPSHFSDFDYTIPVKYTLRPDLLAHSLYGTVNLMWLVLQFNNIVDINTEFTTGKVLRLPKPERVFSSFLSSQTGGKIV